MDAKPDLIPVAARSAPEGHEEMERGKSPEEIRADIEHTRAELNDTVMALRDRVSREHVTKEIFGVMRGAASETVDRVKKGLGEGVKKVGETASKTLRNNGKTGSIASVAVPVLLISLSAGLGLLIWRKWIQPKGRRGTPPEE